MYGVIGHNTLEEAEKQFPRLKWLTWWCPVQVWYRSVQPYYTGTYVAPVTSKVSALELNTNSFGMSLKILRLLAHFGSLAPPPFQPIQSSWSILSFSLSRSQCNGIYCPVFLVLHFIISFISHSIFFFIHLNRGIKDLQCPQCREVIRENQVSKIHFFYKIEI